jgi:outer membrane protein OmpA-like peptidoglycan-associated protein
MKTRTFLLSLLLGFSIHIFAQGSQVFESQEPGRKTIFKPSNAGWFINLSAGGQLYNMDESFDGKSMADRISFIPAISIGKWCNPYLGFRVKGQGLSVNSFIKETGGNITGGNIFKRSNDYVNVHADIMWNLANYFGVYSPDKLFNFTPYAGLGWAHRFELDAAETRPNAPGVGADFRRYSDAFSINGGIQFGFRLSNRVNLDFDLGVTYLGDYFDRMDREGENDNIVHAMGGLTFKLGKTAFEAVEPMDYALIDDLNSKINALRRENELLSKRPVSCPECPPVAPTVVKNEVINYVPNVVFFRLNSSKVDANQQISVFNTATFMKDTGSKITVIGYADKDTGTSAYNLGLSEKRAKAVAKELTTKYNIPSDKIIVEWKGSNEQPYPQNNWNRVVIMSAPK